MKIVVVGAGYVGLSIATLLSQYHTVTLLEISPERVDQINRREVPIHDPGIEEFFRDRKLDLTATGNPEQAYDGAALVFIAVPTNYDPDTRQFDLSALNSVFRSMSKVRDLSSQETCPLIVIKSTIPVGYTKEAKETFGIARLLFCPEFLRETHALEDTRLPSRVVVGYTESDPNAKRDAELLAQILVDASEKKDAPVCLMGLEESEAVKLFANTYLALRVAFFNEMDSFAETRGLNTREIIRGVCTDPRIGRHYNNPSFGYGGYCLPKDTKQLLDHFEGIPNDLIRAVVAANQTRKEFVTNQIRSFAQSSCPAGKEPLIGVYRLSMKKGSDNHRSSSILDVAAMLAESGLDLQVYDPPLGDADTFEGIPVCHSLEQFLETSSCIIANRFDKELENVKGKVYTRDLFLED